ncbi:ribosome maturation factor RimP [Klenkia soli]|uniref:Ribosome maturation factor RimP n=1 Tax=Klenkia soli TaxID=1052260 RepID=A0A1H0I5W3_9ACTN|nr:ribosome maturation factor RimP [Klenkia soli]SDO26816.1 ribosome maturation factor RimP [Klenkia soli]
MSTSSGSRSGPVAAQRLSAWFTPVVVAAGYDLEDLDVRAAGNRFVVRVVVDRDSGVSLDDVAEVSRALSDVLDTHADTADDDLGRSPYVLEVTSPGVDRPLTVPRHWRRNVGRLVTTTVGGAELVGRVVSVDEDAVTLAVEKGGAKKGQVRKAVGNRALTWAELGEGRVQVEFNRPAGHRDEHLVHEGPADEDDDQPLTADDVDELDDEHDDEHDHEHHGAADAAQDQEKQ